MGKPLNLIGQKFGRLTVIDSAKSRKRSNGKSMRFWLCQCECGKTTEVETNHLTSGHTKSCGCLHVDTAGTHGKCFANRMSHSPLWRTYWNMRNRCSNPNIKGYSYYGGRGITVCDEWKGDQGFNNFCKWALSNGYKDSLTLDRIDANGNYEPNNCRWVDRYTQANNKRNNLFLLIDGEKDTVGNWSRRLGISRGNLWNYAKGKGNRKYPYLKIEVCNE